MTITIDVPIRTYSLTNLRGNWRKKWRISKGQREAVGNMLLSKTMSKDRMLPATITLTRIASRVLDGDNLQASLKHVRDAIAEVYGVDDGDERYDWRYQQALGKTASVRITIEVQP